MWALSRKYQHALKASAFGLGVLFAAPFWIPSLEAWRDAVQAEDLMTEQRSQTQTWQAQVDQMTSEALKRRDQFGVLEPISQVRLLEGAKQSGLDLSFLGLDPLINAPALSAATFALQPVRLSVTGDWVAWLDWLTLGASALPGWTVEALALQANAQGGVVGQLTLLAPQNMTQLELPTGLPSRDDAGELSGRDPFRDPFDASAWAAAQSLAAQQNPSHVQRIAPELKRLREPLESFPSEALHYVGHLSMGSGKGGQMHALIRVKAAGSTVHRIKVGEHLGQHFGRVSAITTEHVLVEEWVFDGAGEWLKRELKLPLMSLALAL
jgi:Tfp pilus assembly protein PilP